jgi:competence protein ComEC
MLKKVSKTRAFTLSVLILLNIFIWQALQEEDRRGFMTVAFLDVGQGDAVFIEAPNGNQVLYDAGYGKKVVSEVAELTPLHDRHIDLAIFSHPHADHVGGFHHIFDKYEVGAVIESRVGTDSVVYQELVQLLEEKKVSRFEAVRGMKVILDTDVYIYILYPESDRSIKDPDSASVWAKLVYGDFSVLLTGDAPIAVEEHVAQIDRQRLKSTVLKAGHHGSRTSNSETLLGYSIPDIVVISAGLNNRYGHPHPEILERFSKHGLRSLGTYEYGTIIFKTDGQNISLRCLRIACDI